MQRSDHHDWTSEVYVEEWVKRQRSEDPTRAERFQLMCDLFPFPHDASATILDIGAGYGPVSMFILDGYPNATCVAQDGSAPMLNRARKLMGRYGERFKTHQSDLFDTNWVPKRLGPFDAVVTSICLHNLRDFKRIGEIYGEVHAHLKAGGIFLNVDLINAPTADLWRRYAGVTTSRRQRDGASGREVEAMAPCAERSSIAGTTGPFPADLDQHLAALRAAGFKDVDCFWKETRLALFGGYA